MDVVIVRNPRVRQWWVHMALINFVIFVAESSRGIVMPTLFLYCKSLGGGLYEMGLLTSVYSVGRLISSTVFGYMCDRYSFRLVYIVSAVIGLLGNVVYFVPNTSALIVSRFFVGVSSGNLSVCRSNVAAMTSLEVRLKYLTFLAISVYWGYALTPGLDGFMTGIDYHIFGLPLNEFTAPGLLLVLMNLVTIVLMAIAYDDSISVNDAPEAPKRVSAKVASPIDSFVLSDRLVYAGVVLFIMLNVVARGVLSIYETINVPLFVQVTGDTSTDVIVAASNFQFNLGLLGLLAYLAIEIWHDAISEVKLLVIGFLGLGVGNLILALHATPTYTELWVGVFFLWSVGSPITTAICVSAFSKILGSRQQGKWMGFLGSGASIARIVMPMLPAAFATFAPVLWLDVVLCALSIVMLVAYDRVVAREKATYLREGSPLKDSQTTSYSSVA
ncbi:Major Facilitator Superfamily (MFS) [Achlya hypogyna]|uniref:Major Facilitator Superfamily (MFS) n=1 Tax=Achlya hypogyna TaxID=1202772 RepID=A0A1V9Z707_ACHHY|nr:Major Facilitator Superfamily (MFS) [Achlya hypogyna]